MVTANPVSVRVATQRVKKQTIDGLIALGTLGATVAMLLPHKGPHPPQLTPLVFALAALASLPLVGWRRHPIAVVVVTLAAHAALMVLGFPGGPPVGAVVGLYLLSASRDEPWTAPLTVLMVTLIAAHFGAYAAGHGNLPLLDVGAAALICTLAWFAGERSRLRRLTLAELEGRAQRLELDAERERRLALAEERARIARDLHDSAAHAVNVIAVQAGAARLHLDSDPPRSLAALRTIEDVARLTVAEIDEIVHGLRQPREQHASGAPALVEPPAGLAALDTLVAQHRDSGLDVQVELQGTPRRLRPSVDRAAFRILQEALTNAARHGAGDATVAVNYSAAGVELEVANTALPGAEPHAVGGHGLLGMRERAGLLGGQLEARLEDSAFRVHALLPYAPA